MVEQVQILTLGVSDENDSDNNEPRPPISIDINLYSSDSETCAPSSEPSPGPSKGKGKGKGKRTSVGSLEGIAKKQAKSVKRDVKEQAAERAAKRAANEINKMYKPGECTKHMNIEMHPTLANAWFMADVRREAAALGARVVLAPDLCDPNLVMWSRTLPPRLAADNGQLALGASRSACARALYVTEALHAQEHVAAHTLAQHVGRVRDLVGCGLTVVVFGVRDLFKSSTRKTANSNRKLMTELDLEMAITDLLVTADCDTVIVNSPNELALLLAQVTRAIAEEPYKKAKRACEEQAEFYMKGDNKNCVAVDKDGNGLARLWQQMVAVLPHASLEVARALCARHAAPLLLREALQDPEGAAALASLGVARAGGGARARRLGPEAARRLRILLTDPCGSQLLD